MNRSARKYAAACAVIGMTLGAAEARTPSDQSRSCFETVHQYAVLRDLGPADAYAALFTKDGAFIIAGNTITGREALKKRLEQSLQRERSMHLMSSVTISDDDASGISYVEVLHGDEAGALNAVTYAEYHDQFVFEAGRCLIAKREIKFIFRQVFEARDHQ